MNADKSCSAETIVYLGSYDKGKPRVRLLLDGARAAGFIVHECHVNIWDDIDDKTKIRSTRQSLRYLSRWLRSRLSLLLSYWRAPEHRLVLIPYPGVFELLFFYPGIRLRGAKIILDVFIPIYDTVVNDRRLVAKRSVVAKLLFYFEWLASRVADVVILDTESHGRYFSQLFSLSRTSVEYVPVGVETTIFKRSPYFPWKGESPLEVLFYGQFVPLQGTGLLLEAISLWERSPNFPVRWTVIGTGQDSESFDLQRQNLSLKTIRRINWVPYSELAKWIANSDICCGIFGASEKALNVVPNKVYQVLAVGRPIITADTPGIRSLLEPTSAIELIQPNNPVEIVRGLCRLGNTILECPEELNASIERMPIVGANEVGDQLAKILLRSSLE